MTKEGGTVMVLPKEWPSESECTGLGCWYRKDDRWLVLSNDLGRSVRSIQQELADEGEFFVFIRNLNGATLFVGRRRRGATVSTGSSGRWIRLIGVSEYSEVDARQGFATDSRYIKISVADLVYRSCSANDCPEQYRNAAEVAVAATA